MFRFTPMLFLFVVFFGDIFGAGSALAMSPYGLEVIAKTGQKGVTILNPEATIIGVSRAPSINDLGTVAFHAYLSTGGNGLFIGKGGGSKPININPGFSRNASRVFSGFVQLNNLDQVVARERVGSSNLIRVWVPPFGSSRFTTIVQNLRTTLLDAVMLFPSINNINRFENISAGTGNGDGACDSGEICVADVVFSALKGVFDDFLFTPRALSSPSGGGPFNKAPTIVPVKPMISDNRLIVVRNGNTSNSPIELLNQDLSRKTTIANGGMGFTEVGQSPGINKDGKIVVFVGDRGMGRGIFASIQEDDGTRRMEKIVGESSAIPFIPDFGFDKDGSDVFLQTFELNTRVGIAHRSFGEPGLAGDTFVVTFLATSNKSSSSTFPFPFTGKLGIWTVRVNVLKDPLDPPALDPLDPPALVFQAQTPVPVVQVGGIVNSSIIEGLAIYDPIASVPSKEIVDPRRDHRLAFWATSSTESFIIRANPLFRPVVIDPGHGAYFLTEGDATPGGFGPIFQRPRSSDPPIGHSIVEDEVTLQIALIVKEELKKHAIPVLLTRETFFLLKPLGCLGLAQGSVCTNDIRERIALTRRKKAAVFVSIHTNAHSNPQAHGTEVWRCFDEKPSDKSTFLSLAILDGQVALGLRDRVATSPLSLGSHGQGGKNACKKGVIKGVVRAHKGSDIPAVLTEVAFHSNEKVNKPPRPNEETLLSQADFREKAGKAIAKAIKEFLAIP